MTSLLQRIVSIENGQTGVSSIVVVDNLQTTLDTKQDVLTAGDNISIVDNVISATGSGGGGDVSQSDLDTKQDVLTAGDNISIVDNVISASGGSGSSGPITISDVENLQTSLDTKQNTLTAGTNISIVDNIISSSGSGSSGPITISDVENLETSLDRKQNIVCKSNGNIIDINGLTIFNLTPDTDTNIVDFVSHASGTFTFSKAGLYKVSAHVGVFSVAYSERVMCRLMPTVNDAYSSNFPIGYGYIRGSATTVDSCSCDVSFMVNLNANDYMRFALEQAKDNIGTFGTNMFNTRVVAQSVIFEFLG